MTAAPPPLAPDIAAGLRRLKLAAMRQLAPELLITAKTQRWAPEELLRTLIDAEITAREASNARTRMKTAAFPVIKTLDELDRPRPPSPARPWTTSPPWNGSPPRRTCAWSGRRHGQEPCPGLPGRRRCPRRAQGPLLHRRRPDRHPLPRPGRQLRRRIIENLLRNDLILVDEVGFAPLDDTGAQLLFRFVSAAYERRALGIASHWPFDLGPVPARAHHRRQPPGPPAPPRERRGHQRRFVPDAPGPS